jgi:hypothetical protein
MYNRVENSLFSKRTILFNSQNYSIEAVSILFLSFLFIYSLFNERKNDDYVYIIKYI